MTFRRIVVWPCNGTSPKPTAQTGDSSWIARRSTVVGPDSCAWCPVASRSNRIACVASDCLLVRYKREGWYRSRYLGCSDRRIQGVSNGTKLVSEMYQTPPTSLITTTKTRHDTAASMNAPKQHQSSARICCRARLHRA